MDTREHSKDGLNPIARQNIEKLLQAYHPEQPDQQFAQRVTDRLRR